MLKVDGVSLERGGRRILEGLELDLAPGEVRLLVGASGSGKTTLLRSVAGLEVPEAGRILIEDRLVTVPGEILVEPHARGVALTFQDGALWPHLSVERHLLFGLDARVPERERRNELVDSLLERVGLFERRRERPAHLSGGERQRLGLARALAQQPRLLLLDEPLANVDLAGQRTLAELVLELIGERSMTALWVTHRPDEVSFVEGKVSVLSGGCIAKTLAAAEFPSWLAEAQRGSQTSAVPAHS
jgi:iron(III) transport system ATP-binding protein